MVQSNATDVAVRRHAHGEREFARQMKGAVTRDLGEIGERDVALDVCGDVIENAAQPNTIERLRR